MRPPLTVTPIASRVTPQLVAAVERELGDVETMLTERRWHAAELAEKACRSFERVYVLSGDGGYNEAVNGADGEVPLAFLPGGATNVLPRALGLPRDPLEWARAPPPAAEPAGRRGSRRRRRGRLRGGARGAGRRRRGARLSSVGILDWYLVGLAAGLGATAGAAFVWGLPGGGARVVAGAAGRA